MWVTVAFVDHDAQLPDGRGTAFDVLDRAAARGLDVRVLFWREPELASLLPDSEHFAGTDEERDWLRGRGARFRARWDHLPHYCHHQKSWVLDAGEPGELAFVGGINLDRGSIVVPGHPPRPDGPSVHDLYRRGRGACLDRRRPQLRAALERGERARPPRRLLAGCRRRRPAAISVAPRSAVGRGAGADRAHDPARHLRRGSRRPGRGAVPDRGGRVEHPRAVPRRDRRRPRGHLHREPVPGSAHRPRAPGAGRRTRRRGGVRPAGHADGRGARNPRPRRPGGALLRGARGAGRATELHARRAGVERRRPAARATSTCTRR